jgi:uncharacterized protein (DUF697 family)
MHGTSVWATREATNVSENERKALETVKHHMWWSMGAGLIPVPIVDLAAVSGVQLKMLAAISKIYEVKYQENVGKAVIASLGGFMVPHALSYGVVGSLLKAVPVVGALAGAPAMALFSGASAWALGKVFIQHFESGGTFLNFEPEQVREHYRTHFEEGHKSAAAMKDEQKAGAPG